MYMSRVKIDTGNRQKTKELTHPGAYHNWVEQCFPEEINSHERSRKLWRTDWLKGEQYLLVVSREAPDFERLERFGVHGTAETRKYDSFLANLTNGMKCRFRVVLNPVVSVPKESGKRGKVMPEVTAEFQRQYLLKRAEKNGFYLNDDEFEITERGFVHWYKGKEHVRLCRVAYEGILVIKDAEVFRQMLMNGMGKKKAYGFGLMTVIPVLEQ